MVDLLVFHRYGTLDEVLGFSYEQITLSAGAIAARESEGKKPRRPAAEGIPIESDEDLERHRQRLCQKG